MASSHTNQCQFYYTLEWPLPRGALEFNAFNHPWAYQACYVFPPPELVPLVQPKFLAEHVTGQFRLILVTPCWMRASWLPTLLHMLEEISAQCPILKDFVMDVLVGWVFNSLQLLYLNPLDAQRCVYVLH